MLQYFIFYKPYQVLSQFSPEGNKTTLADHVSVAKDIYPVGRLDYDSEGLLLLTNDKALNHRLLHPVFGHEREYWVQVEGMITDAALQQLQKGVQLQVNGKLYTTQPCLAFLFDAVPLVPARHPPIRFRKYIPASWIRVVLREGKNRQVRKMTAAVGFPTLRLIRYRIGQLTIAGMQPGDLQALDQPAVYKALFEH